MCTFFGFKPIAQPPLSVASGCARHCWSSWSGHLKNRNRAVMMCGFALDGYVTLAARARCWTQIWTRRWHQLARPRKTNLATKGCWTHIWTRRWHQLARPPKTNRLSPTPGRQSSWQRNRRLRSAGDERRSRSLTTFPGQ